MSEENLNINASGFLEIDQQRIYWEDWGNPGATPIFHLHGGPGAGFSDSNKLLYDPKLHRVIFHDQRGSGKSMPHGDTSDNTSQKLIGDIEVLRMHLGIEHMYVAGGSWGSTLALLYAIAHPDRVEKLLLRSLYLARQFENDFVNEGYPRYSFPLEWERFISLVPKEQRNSGDEVMRFYAGKINSPDQEVARTYADEWNLWEATLCSITYDPAVLQKEILGDEDNLVGARIQVHYLLNDCFVPENYILDNIERIKHIPCMLVQGRFDMCTPVISAIDFKRAYGDNLTLQIINSGHLSSDPKMFETFRAMASDFLGEQS